MCRFKNVRVYLKWVHLYFITGSRTHEPLQAFLFISLCNYALRVPDNRIQGKKNDGTSLLQPAPSEGKHNLPTNTYIIIESHVVINL